MRRIAPLLALLCAAPAAAETVAFDIFIAGLKVAALTMEGDVTGTRYTVSGVIRTTGAVQALRRVSYVAEASGRVRDGQFRPSRYTEDVRIGQHQAATSITWDAGPPIAEITGETRPHGDPPDPAGQTRAVDPLTALFAGLRDTTRAEACDLDLAVYDGRRASRASLSNPVESAHGLTCTGVYARLMGFTEREMAHRRTFPFTAAFAAEGERLRLIELRTETTFGPAVLRRK